jgi:hypothetical protein
MSDLHLWSTTASNNDDPPPDGAPENMFRSKVNDVMREIMASVRRWYDDPEWLNFCAAASGFVKNSATEFEVTGLLVASYFPPGRYVKVIGTVTTYGFVSTAVEGGGNTTVTIVLAPGEADVPATISSVLCYIGESLGEAAFRDVGMAAEKLVRYDDFGDHAFQNDGAGDADTVDGKHYVDIYQDLPSGRRNLLVNGCFRRWQEGTSFTNPANDSYVSDQWKILKDSAANVDVARDTSDKPDGAYAAAVLTFQANPKAGIFQLVEARDSALVIGTNPKASLSFWVKRTGTSIVNCRYMIVSWAGSEDDATGTALVTAPWAAEGGDPTVNGSFTNEGSGTVALTTSWQRVTLPDIAVDAVGAKNVGVLIWADEDTITIGDKLHIGNVKLNQGSVAAYYSNESAHDMLGRTARFFCKTFNEATTPAHNQGLAHSVGSVLATTLGHGVISWTFPTRMAKVPAITYYNPSNASPGTNYVRSNRPGDCPVSASEIGDRGVQVRISDTNEDRYQVFVCAVANARIF